MSQKIRVHQGWGALFRPRVWTVLVRLDLNCKSSHSGRKRLRYSLKLFLFEFFAFAVLINNVSKLNSCLFCIFFKNSFFTYSFQSWLTIHYLNERGRGWEVSKSNKSNIATEIINQIIQNSIHRISSLGRETNAISKKMRKNFGHEINITFIISPWENVSWFFKKYNI